MTQQNQEYTLYSQILLNPEARSYPCLCLCFGFSQMILIAPLRLMTLHFSQMGFTEGLSFMLISSFVTWALYLERQVMRPLVRS